MSTDYRFSTRNHDQVISEAKAILYKRLQKTGIAVTSPNAARDFLTIELSEEEKEVFSVMFLNNQHQLIAFERMFNGTIDGASVYPREVAKAALQVNAAAVILAHNHPSGVTTPSQADKAITSRLTEALNLLDVRVIDHIIVAGDKTASFAEMGLL